MYSEVFVSIGWTLLTFLVGWFSRKWTRRRRELRPAARVWKIDPGIPVSLVTADAPMRDQEELTPMVYPAEYAAATALSLHLTRVFGCKIVRICPSSDFPLDRSLEENIVVIGGPNHNNVFRIFDMNLTLPYAFEGYDLVRLPDRHTFSSVVENDEIKYDVGLVVLAPNPFNQRARTVFLAGCRTYGCLAAAQAVSDSSILQSAEVVGNGRINILVVGVNVIGQYISTPKVLDSMSVE